MGKSCRSLATVSLLSGLLLVLGASAVAAQVGGLGGAADAAAGAVGATVDGAADSAKETVAKATAPRAPAPAPPPKAAPPKAAPTKAAPAPPAAATKVVKPVTDAVAGAAGQGSKTARGAAAAVTNAAATAAAAVTAPDSAAAVPDGGAAVPPAAASNDTAGAAADQRAGAPPATAAAAAPATASTATAWTAASAPSGAARTAQLRPPGTAELLATVTVEGDGQPYAADVDITKGPDDQLVLDLRRLDVQSRLVSSAEASATREFPASVRVDGARGFDALAQFVIAEAGVVLRLLRPTATATDLASTGGNLALMTAAALAAVGFGALLVGLQRRRVPAAEG